MSMQLLALVFLVAVAGGGIAWVLLYPLLAGERAAERIDHVARPEPARQATKAAGIHRLRREEIEATLKEFEARRREITRPTLALRLERAGLRWSKRQFVIASGVCGGAGFVLAMLFGASFGVATALGFAAGFGVPRWLLSYLCKRRQAKFLHAFPDAVDIIVRGVKAGLPLHESIRAIVNDSPEPIRSEFRAILETQAIGMPLGEACTRLYQRMVLPEANFFGIVIAIQQQAGGNLSEALGNLSRVLRDRKRMKEKIKAMSSEAKASALIIGSLPLVVMAAVYLVSPGYISLLWTHPIGRLMLGGCAIWMMMGVLVMKKMVNFDF